MFSIENLIMIAAALGLAAKSAQRLSNREGQPENVKAEYVKVLGEQSALQRKVQVEIDKLKTVKK